MMVDMGLIAKVKTAIRISHNKLDDEVGDDIATCLQELRVLGISAPMPDDPQEMDPLILSAVKLHAKSNFTDDSAKAADYKKRYDSLVSFLMTASEYDGGGSS